MGGERNPRGEEGKGAVQPKRTFVWTWGDMRALPGVKQRRDVNGVTI